MDVLSPAFQRVWGVCENRAACLAIFKKPLQKNIGHVDNTGMTGFSLVGLNVDFFQVHGSTGPDSQPTKLPPDQWEEGECNGASR